MKTKKVLKAASILLVAVMLLFASNYSVFADTYDEQKKGDGRDNAWYSATRYINNSQFWNEQYDQINVEKSYTILENLDGSPYAYAFDVNFAGKKGVAIVEMDTNEVLEVWEDTFLMNQDADKLCTDNSERMISAYIFAGPQTVLLKVDGANGPAYIDSRTKQKVDKEQEEVYEQKLQQFKENKLDMQSNNMNANRRPTRVGYTSGSLKYTYPIVNQMNFSTVRMQNTGCGEAAGAILAWYLGKNSSAYNGIVSGYSSAQSLGDTTITTCMDGIVGTLPVQFKSGMGIFMNFKNSALRTTEVPNSVGASSMWGSIKNIITSKNEPIAMFLGQRVPGDPYPAPSSGAPALHWITIVGWEEDNAVRYVNYESWGSFYTDNYNALCNWTADECLEYFNVVIN